MKTLKKPWSIINCLLTLLFFIGCSTVNTQEKPADDILWYSKPATSWQEALPLGNGRLGVMVFGDPHRERIQLNDDSLWPADLGWDEPVGSKDDLQQIRQLLFAGKNAAADKLFVDKFSRKQVVRSHQTLGDLFIDLDHGKITDYRRELNISNATSTVSYNADGSRVTEKVFVSHPHQAILIEFESQAEAGLNGKVRLTRPEDEGHATAITITAGTNILIMQGEVTQRAAKFDSKPAPILNGVKFETLLKVNNEGGEIINGKDYLELKNVRKATFYLVSNSSFYHQNYSAKNKKDLALIEKESFETLKTQHIQDYQALYSRVALKITDNPLDSIPINERLALVKKDSVDLGLETLLFQYGRYLLISSSRPGTNPANLQGLWNEHIKAPWNADYHLNINLQMNYWLADVTNLSELNAPPLRLYRSPDRAWEGNSR